MTEPTVDSLSAEEAQAKMNAMFGDKAHPFNNKTHPDHQQAIDRYLQLHGRANPAPTAQESLERANRRDVPPPPPPAPVQPSVTWEDLRFDFDWTAAERVQFRNAAASVGAEPLEAQQLLAFLEMRKEDVRRENMYDVNETRRQAEAGYDPATVQAPERPAQPAAWERLSAADSQLLTRHYARLPKAWRVALDAMLDDQHVVDLLLGIARRKAG